MTSQPSIEGLWRQGDEPFDVFVNVYPDRRMMVAHPSKRDAETWAAKNRVECIKLRYFPGRATGNRFEEVVK